MSDSIDHSTIAKIVGSLLPLEAIKNAGFEPEEFASKLAKLADLYPETFLEFSKILLLARIAEVVTASLNALNLILLKSLGVISVKPVEEKDLLDEIDMLAEGDENERFFFPLVSV